jgi:hypothetical protein
MAGHETKEVMKSVEEEQHISSAHVGPPFLDSLLAQYFLDHRPTDRIFS